MRGSSSRSPRSPDSHHHHHHHYHREKDRKDAVRKPRKSGGETGSGFDSDRIGGTESNPKDSILDTETRWVIVAQLLSM